jgi:hypothetical protein
MAPVLFRAGVDAGSRLRVRGEGNVGRRGGEPGDLYVFISVKPHPAGLRREGTTIHSEVDVSFVDAILGTTVKVCAPWRRSSWPTSSSLSRHLQDCRSIALCQDTSWNIAQTS